MYITKIIFPLQQTISSENVLNMTSQLQTVVSQATERVDQSASNLDVVTAVITQIANISLQNTTIENDVDAISLCLCICTNLISSSDHLKCCFSSK